MIGVTGGIAAHVGHVHPTPEVLTQVRFTKKLQLLSFVYILHQSRNKKFRLIPDYKLTNGYFALQMLVMCSSGALIGSVMSKRIQVPTT
jgi:hypothetical protein